MKEESYQLLLSLGYTNKKAQEIVNSSLLHSHKDETLFKNILNVYNYLKKYYTKNEIIKMTKTLPSLYNFSTEAIKQKIKEASIQELSQIIPENVAINLKEYLESRDSDGASKK